MKAEADKVFTDMIKIGATHGYIKVFNIHPCKKWPLNSSRNTTRTNTRKQNTLFQPKSSQPKSNPPPPKSTVPSLVVTVEVAQSIGPPPKVISSEIISSNLIMVHFL